MHACHGIDWLNWRQIEVLEQAGFISKAQHNNIIHEKKKMEYFTCIQRSIKVSGTLKIAIFPYLGFQRFQIDMLESFLWKKKSEENIISVERYRG